MNSALWEALHLSSLSLPLVQVTHNDLAVFSRLTWCLNTLPTDSSLAGAAEWGDHVSQKSPLWLHGTPTPSTP